MSSESDENSIAIIGMSCRFPGANTPEEFWEVLREGKDVTCEVPKDRRCYDQLITHLKRGGFLKCAVDEMDANFFSIPPKEAVILDPQQRLLLETTWEALEKAGINPLSLKGTKTGVYIGVWSNDYEKVLQNSSAPQTCEFHVAYLSIALGGTAARISYFLGLHGPHGSTDAGCASSLYSIHQACESLRNGDTNLAIAGGVNLLLFPVIGKYGSMVFAPDGRCKTFDAKVDGYGRAEGCGSLILKRYAEAIKDGDKILAIIRGTAINSDAASATFGTPCKFAQTKVIRDALQDAKISPERISYVEVHGTGTEVGDSVEMAALASGYAHRKRQRPLVVGSVKTNMGHAEAAAGLAGIVKLVLSLQNQIIPAHLNFKNLSPHVNMKAVPATIPLVAEKWENDESSPRIGAVSAFALGGQNAHLIIEEAPKIIESFQNSKNQVQVERPVHILTISAKCESALSQIVNQYGDLLETLDESSLGDVTFTANTTKASFQHRISVLGKNCKELRDNLRDENYLISRGKTLFHKQPKIAFIFNDGDTGENLCISKIFYETNVIYKQCVDSCNDIYKNNTGQSLLDGKEKQGMVGYGNNLPLLFVVQYSLFKLWQSLGAHPDIVLGHGLGEFAAAAAAEILSLEDSMKFVIQLQKIVDQLPLRDTLTIRSTEEQTKQVLEQHFPELDIISVNLEDEVTVTGEQSQINKFADFCPSKGIRVTENSENRRALHSKAATKCFENDLQNIVSSLEFNTSSCGFVSGVTGGLLGESHFKYDEEYWSQLLTQTVKFAPSVKLAAEEGCRIFVEIGTHPYLLGIAMSNLEQKDAHASIWLPTLRKDDENWETLLTSLGKIFINGGNVRWDGLDLGVSRRKTELPTYPFQRQKFWIS